MELDWRNRCVGGERLEDLYEVLNTLGVTSDDELFRAVWKHPQAALAFHRAIMRIAAELLWQRAARLAPWHVLDPHRVESLMRCVRRARPARRHRARPRQQPADRRMSAGPTKRRVQRVGSSPMKRTVTRATAMSRSSLP